MILRAKVTPCKSVPRAKETHNLKLNLNKILFQYDLKWFSIISNPITSNLIIVSISALSRSKRFIKHAKIEETI